MTIDIKNDLLDRESLRIKFLNSCNIKSEDVRLFSSDASSREYYSCAKNPDILLMDSPPNDNLNQNFIDIASFLNKIGLSAPKVYQSDYLNGFFLVENLGESTLGSLLKASNLSEEKILNLYELISDTIVFLHETDCDLNLGNYTKDILLAEIKPFVEYYLPIWLGENVTQSAKDDFYEIWSKLLDHVDIFPKKLVLRDMHVDNMILISNRSGLKRLGLIDFQDALYGSPIYDLVSVLEDARFEVPTKIVQHVINRYLNFYKNITRKDFLLVYAILAAQRNSRILGLFASKVDLINGKKYLQYVPLVKKYLDNNISHPILLPLKSWLEKTMAG